MKPGQQLLTHDGRLVTIESVKDTGEVAPVFNFRVAEFHTYYVGSPDWGFDVWVHNICQESIDKILQLSAERSQNISNIDKLKAAIINIQSELPNATDLGSNADIVAARLGNITENIAELESRNETILRAIDVLLGPRS